MAPLRKKTERVGSFTLTLSLDGKQRLRRAQTAHFTLDLEVDRYASHDGSGSEEWKDGRVKGTWLDLPYGHECDVDEAVDREAWIREKLSELRGGAFWALPKKPKPAELRALWTYALRHGLFRRSVLNPGAGTFVQQYAAIATRAELTRLIGHFESGRLRDYLRAASEGARKDARDLFRNAVIPDGKAEARAIARAATLCARHQQKIDVADPSCVAQFNNLSRGLIDRDLLPEAAQLLEAIRDIINSRHPPHELSWGPTAARHSMDEYYFRHHAATWCWRTKAFAAGIPDSRRAVLLEDLLDKESQAGRLEPRIFSSSGAWALMSCLAETRAHPEAAKFFAAMMNDGSRLRRRLASGPTLEGALIAGFYATFKAKPVDPVRLRPLFDAALGVVKEPSLPLLAHWYAFVSCTLNEVDKAAAFIQRGVSLGLTAESILDEREWKPFLKKHGLRDQEPWRSWLVE